MRRNAFTDTVMSGFRDHGAIIKRVGQLALISTQRSDPQIVANVMALGDLRRDGERPTILSAYGYQGKVATMRPVDRFRR